MMSTQDQIVVTGAKRSPIGGFQGQFSDVAAPRLAAAAVVSAVKQSGVEGAAIDDAIIGCVLPAGLGQAPARQAVLAAGLPNTVPCTTVNKMCGSGLKAVMLAHDLITAGSARIVVAGGMESMTNAPYLLPKARGGYRLGHGQIADHMILDGLQSPFDNEIMGAFAEKCADRFGFTRQQQDDYAAESVRRAQDAVRSGAFRAEIAPVSVNEKGGQAVIDQDETPMKCDIDRIASLKPAFKKNGSVTAANSSSISDGAAAVVLMQAAEARRLSASPLARIVGHATHAQEPEWFTTAPIGAISSLLKKLGWSANDVDLFEINEAFAVVTMAAMRELDLPHSKVNVNGGACALGHPIGATGARILVTLIYALRKRGLKRGVASLCLGGGEATAMAVEID